MGKNSGKIGDATLIATRHKYPASKVLVVGFRKWKKLYRVHLHQANESAFNTIIRSQMKHGVPGLLDRLRQELPAPVELNEITVPV
jgi:hypothetical protein